jgi:hypothetical protein
VRESGKPWKTSDGISLLSDNPGEVWLELESGSYYFRAQMASGVSFGRKQTERGTFRSN